MINFIKYFLITLVSITISVGVSLIYLGLFLINPSLFFVIYSLALLLIIYFIYIYYLGGAIVGDSKGYNRRRFY